MKNKMLMLLCVLAVMASLSALPATAGEVTGTSAAPIVNPAPAPGGCGQALDLALITQTGGMCPAAAFPAPAPEPMANPFARRTCVCSCGYPCKTDADCGPGGRCGPGITCC
jgi:hypothetical protein